MIGALNTALDRFTGTLRGINDNAGTLASSSEELTAVAGRTSSSATRSAGRAPAVATASGVSTASGRITGNIATVSTGAIVEVARSTSDAADLAGPGVRISGEAGAILQQLGTSSVEMSRNVVAPGSQQISANVAEVAAAVTETTGAAADRLARVANESQKSLAAFRY